MKIEDLLKYQELEVAVLNIEKKLNETDEFKVYVQCNAIVKQAKQTISELDSEAEKLIKDVEISEAAIKDTSEKISAAKALCTSADDISKLEALEKNIAELNRLLQRANTDLTQTGQRIYAVMAEAQKNVDRYKEANEKGTEVSAKLKEIKSKLEEESEPFRKQLAEIQKNLPKYALDLYDNAKKHNKIYWVVERENGYCIGCGQNVELETAKKMEELGIAECPRCFRVLYVK
ncbi:MAG: hypothetical protein ACOYIQ_00055 [Christensenellales bacterium]|jgi:predicted  nucleic acid-binding Zn-ribbon protein